MPLAHLTFPLSDLYKTIELIYIELLNLLILLCSLEVYRTLPHPQQNLAVSMFCVPHCVQNLLPLADGVTPIVLPLFKQITFSAISKALSSSFDCCIKPQICVIMTGQKNSIDIAVGIACCPQIPTPASKRILEPYGSNVTFKAVFIPKTALNNPRLVIEIS